MSKRSQNATDKERHEIPHWRRIEILREKAELKAALGDLESDFDEIDEEVFGSDEEYITFHKHTDNDDGAVEELLDDDDSDDEFEDFEDD